MISVLVVEGLIREVCVLQNVLTSPQAWVLSSVFFPASGQSGIMVLGGTKHAKHKHLQAK